MAPVLHGRKCIQAPADICVYGLLSPHRRFYVHKLLLMCISPYFEKVFKYRTILNSSRTPCVYCNASLSDSQKSSSTCDNQSTGDQQKQKASSAGKDDLSVPAFQVVDQNIGQSTSKHTLIPSTHDANSVPQTNVINCKLNDATGCLKVCDCLTNSKSTLLKPASQLSSTDLVSSTSFQQTLICSNSDKLSEIKCTNSQASFLSAVQDIEKLILSDLDGDQVQSLLQFAYDGHVEIDHRNVESLCLAADMYSVQGLFELCQDYLIDSLCVQNCVGIYIFSQKLQCSKLEMIVERYILRNFEMVSTRSTEFPSLLSADQMKRLLSQNRLYVSDEYTVFLALIRWIQFDNAARICQFDALIQHVRLALINSDTLTDCVLVHPFLKKNSKIFNLIKRVTCSKSRLQLMERPDKQLLKDTEMHAHLTPRFPIDLIFVFGGRTLDVEFVPPEPIIEVYDHRAERWRQIAALQDPLSTRDHHQTVVLDGDIYLLGGHSGPFNVYNSCRKYCFKSKKWCEIAPMREKRAFLASVVLKGYIYAIGGYNGAWRVDTVERYDKNTNQWKSVASMHERRSGAGAAVLNDRIYVVGGFRDLTYLNTAEFYCPENNTWTSIGLMQKPRSSPSVVSTNGFIYAIGGLGAGGLLASGERYDPATGTWNLLENEMLDKKCSAAAVVLEGKIFVIGGWNGLAGLNTVEIWCPQTKRWLLGSKLSKRRTGCSACIVQDVPDIEKYAWSSRQNLIFERFMNAFVETSSQCVSSDQMQID